MANISIIVPVGPNPKYRDYLPECLQSIVEQMEAGDEILIVDDWADLPAETFAAVPVPEGAFLNYVRTEWRMGCADAWNMGVGLALNENCILMGSDDKLLLNCLSSCRSAIDAADYDPLGYYNLTCMIATGETVAAFNNAAMVSKKLWYHLGGFPPSAGLGAPDALIVSIMMIHMPEHLRQLREGQLLYWCRVHDAQDTLQQGAFFNWEVINVRDKETARWKPSGKDVR